MYKNSLTTAFLGGSTPPKPTIAPIALVTTTHNNGLKFDIQYTTPIQPLDGSDDGLLRNAHFQYSLTDNSTEPTEPNKWKNFKKLKFGSSNITLSNGILNHSNYNTAFNINQTINFSVFGKNNYFQSNYTNSVNNPFRDKWLHIRIAYENDIKPDTYSTFASKSIMRVKQPRHI